MCYHLKTGDHHWDHRNEDMTVTEAYDQGMGTKQDQREHGGKMKNIIPLLFGVGISEMTDAADDVKDHKKRSTRYCEQGPNTVIEGLSIREMWSGHLAATQFAKKLES